MPTIITHGVASVLLGKTLLDNKLVSRENRSQSFRFWFWVVICSILPDIDVVGFLFNIPYASIWGHRGLTHSLLFSAMVGLSVGYFFKREKGRSFFNWINLWWSLFFFLIVASHGVFDALTDGGLGVAFFSPFETTRYFFPTAPIEVSPIGVRGFLTKRGLDVLVSEAQLVIAPLILVHLVFKFIKLFRR